MKRPIFIIAGVIFVILLLVIWVYVLFFGSPENGDGRFGDLNFGDTTDPTVDVREEPEPEEPVVDVTDPERLRQLTTQPVAGFQEVYTDASSSPKLLYVEAGVGHVFRIDLETGAEDRVSGTTIPGALQAAITPNGEYIMLQAGRGSAAEFLVGQFSSTSEEVITEPLTEVISDFEATDTNTFLYSVKTANSLVAKEYDPEQGTSETLFSVPFREAAIAWGASATTTHYAFPKPASRLEGFGYAYRPNGETRLPVDGYGLTLTGNDRYVVFSRQIQNEFRSYIHNRETGETSEYPFAFLPDKCTFLHSTGDTMVCAQELTSFGVDMPDNWYKGVTRFSDSLWEMDLTTLSSTELVDIEAQSGRTIDVISLTSNLIDTNLYFQSNRDQTLWMYERVEQ